MKVTSYNIISKNSSLKFASASDARSSRSQMFFERGVLKYFANFKTLLKRDSNTSVFLWNLRNFQEYLFLQNASGGCLCDTFRSVFRTLSNIWDAVFCENSQRLMQFFRMFLTSYVLSKNYSPYFVKGGWKF